MYMDNIKILGFKASINSIEETLDLINSIKDDDEIIQLINADSIVSRNHIIHGVNQAFLAFNRGENLAKDISVEIVLRCSAQRQISKAFKILGLKKGNMNLCAILINSKDYTNELSSFFTLDNSVLTPDNEMIPSITATINATTRTIRSENILDISAICPIWLFRRFLKSISFFITNCLLFPV